MNLHPKSSRHSRPWFHRWCALALFILVTPWVYAGAVVGNEKIKAAGFKEKCIQEPVFNGQACIFQANTRANKTVVVVHGLGGEAANWYHQLVELKKHYHVLTFDLPGFGSSSKGNQFYTPTSYARFIHFVTKKYAKGKFHLIGYSMGGAIVLRYTASYPQDVDRLIVADAAGILHRHAYTKSVAFRYLESLQKFSVYLGPGLQERVAGLAESMENFPIDIRRAMAIPKLRQIILKGNPTPIAFFGFVTEDFSQVLEKIATPTLIIWGAYDIIAPLRTGKMLQASMQNAYLKVLTNAAHASMSDQPKKFNKLMLSHLQSPIRNIRKRYWRAKKFVKSERIGSCSHGEEQVFEGAYARIELNGCRHATIRDAQVGAIIAQNSTLDVENSIIKNDLIGLVANHSTVNITSTEIIAKVAIQADASRLDLAGVKLMGSQYAVNALSPSTFVFSISETAGGKLHTFRRLAADEKI